MEDVGQQLCASVQANRVCVNIGQFWLPKNQTEYAPTEKGICLRPTEYSKLKGGGVFNHRTQTFIYWISSFTWKKKKETSPWDRRFCSGTELCCFLCLQIGSHESAKLNTGESWQSVTHRLFPHPQHLSLIQVNHDRVWPIGYSHTRSI
jgi:hypothetical protein